MNSVMRAVGIRAIAGLVAAGATTAGVYLLAPETVSSLSFDSPDLLPLLLVTVLTGLCAAVDVARPASDSGGSVRLTFLATLAAARLYDVRISLVVAAVGAITDVLLHPESRGALRRSAVDVVTAVAAAGVASTAYGFVAPVVPSGWPWATLPVAVFAAMYGLVAVAVSGLLAALLSGESAPHRWPTLALRALPGFMIGAAIAVAITDLALLRSWALIPPAALTLALAWITYRRYVTALAAGDHRFEVVRSTDHGVCVVGDDGLVRASNERLATLLGRASASIVDRTFASVLVDRGAPELLDAVTHTLSDRAPRSLSRVRIRAGSTLRVLSVSVLPDAGGVLVVCQDVTEQAQWEESMRENAERFAIVSHAANDGMWELDLVRGTLFVSPRWRALVGLPDVEERATGSVWFSRVHPSDLPELEKAIASVRARDANRFELQHRLRHENGSYRSVEIRAVAVHDANGKPVRLGGSMTDVTDDAIALAKIHNAESRDPLTGLLNRAAFVADLGRRLKDYRERRGDRFAALYLDLDRFKVINDSLGHLVGDELLVEVSRRLETCLRPGDAIARLGGDEFAILLHGLGDEMQANVIAFRLQEALQTPFPISGRDVVTSASIGIALCRQEYESPEEIMRDADTAMYAAKAHGKARHELFDADMHARALDRLGLESDLRHAVKNSSFEVHYQPIVSLSNRMCTGFESLVRWNRNGKAVSPAEFVPMAEELGIIEPLGTWVMREACRTFSDWKLRFPDSQLEYITVNVSARQLVQQGFIYLVEQVVEQNGMNPGDLRLEITETALMDAPQFAAQVLGELREFGVKIYLDDFGTGYSSLSHLHKLPVDALKIDRSFVRGLLMTDRPAIVESILALAHTLHTNVVAEGVEDELQAAELERLGCSLAQGYYFSRPVSATTIEELIGSGKPLGGPRQAPAVAVPGRRGLAAVRTRGIA